VGNLKKGFTTKLPGGDLEAAIPSINNQTGGTHMNGATRKWQRRAVFVFGAFMLAVAPAWSDTLTLRNGHSVPGYLIGADKNSVTFKDCDGGTRNYSVADVESIHFSGGNGDYNRPGEANRDDQVCSDQSPSGQIVLPSGTEIPVRTNDRIDSRDAREDQAFPAQIAEDVPGEDGSIAIPRGSDVSLITRRLEKNGDITLDVESIMIAGRRFRVSTADQEIDARGENLGANKRTGKFVGGGAALGAIVGAIAGGGKGAAIGAVAGAGAGAGAQIITQGKEVHVPAETVLRFRLDRPLKLQPWS
jgi:hypothetical protein